MSSEQYAARTAATKIPVGPVRLNVGADHHRCMADSPITLVPVSDAGGGYPWWITPHSIDGIDLDAGMAYVLDVVISAGAPLGRCITEALEYRLVAVVEQAACPVDPAAAA